MNLKTKIAAAGMVAGMAVTAPANAVVYDITAVLNGVDNGFGFSQFHYAGDLGSGIDGDGNPMTGTVLVGIPQTTGMLGTYDDVSGAFYVELSTDLAAVPTFSLSGTLLFDNSGFLDPGSSLDITFTDFLDNNYTTAMDFTAGQQCCGGSNPPNSFVNGLMSLWGVNNTPELAPFFPDYNDQILGLDLRIELTPVPVPAAVWLFGTGLLGLVGVARRRA